MAPRESSARKVHLNGNNKSYIGFCLHKKNNNYWNLIPAPCDPVITVNKQLVSFNTKGDWLFEQSYSEKDNNFKFPPNIKGQRISS